MSKEKTPEISQTDIEGLDREQEELIKKCSEKEKGIETLKKLKDLTFQKLNIGGKDYTSEDLRIMINLYDKYKKQQDKIKQVQSLIDGLSKLRRTEPELGYWTESGKTIGNCVTVLQTYQNGLK